jgi:catechol 2,3-dioxygenase-like lactoylglutathione lyase family enzyme
MPLEGFDHVNVRTANLEAMKAFYTDVLGMQAGPRPPFSFPGAWMYLGQHAVIHLVGVERQPAATEPALEHVAFAAKGLGEFLDRLDRAGIAWRPGIVPGFGTVQINIHDPDGNHLHIDFAPEEAAALEGRR